MKRKAILILMLCLPALSIGATAIMNSWQNGELTPRLYGRTDAVPFYSGARIVENMFVSTHGPVTKRPGTYYIADAAGEARVIAFQDRAERAYILELSNESIRFYIDQ